MAFSVDQALALVRGAAQNGRLAHALLISGSYGADLQRVAMGVANLVNGWDAGSLDELRLHGAQVIEPESKLRRIKVAQMRELERDLQLTSPHRMKIGIIVDADRQMPEAANAFLKTLEEPPPDTLLMLLTRQPEQLLETVRSRCLRLPLYRPGEKGMALSPDQERIVDALGRHFSENLSTGAALALLCEFQEVLGEIKDGIRKENELAYKEEVTAYAKTTDGAWLKGRDDYYDDLSEAQYQEQRSALLALLFVWFGEILRRQSGAAAVELPRWNATTAAVAKKFNPGDILRRLRAVEEMRRNLTTTVREALAMEVGFLKAFGSP
jgi:DNA polymerase-3 subunit delta'